MRLILLTGIAKYIFNIFLCFLEKERKNAKDVLLDEAVYIVSDQVGLIKNGPRLTAQLKPGIKSIAN